MRKNILFLLLISAVISGCVANKNKSRAELYSPDEVLGFVSTYEAEIKALKQELALKDYVLNRYGLLNNEGLLKSPVSIPEKPITGREKWQK